MVARVEKLERDNRRTKSIGLLALATLVGLVIMAPSSGQQATNPVPNEITAKKFVLLDNRGEVRATLETRDTGWPYGNRASLTLYSRDKMRKTVILSDDTLNRLSLENNQPGTGAKIAQMQVGTEGVGLEMSEYFLSTSSHNMFSVHWASETQATPTLEILKSKPNSSVRLTPSSSTPLPVSPK